MVPWVIERISTAAVRERAASLSPKILWVRVVNKQDLSPPPQPSPSQTFVFFPFGNSATQQVANIYHSILDERNAKSKKRKKRKETRTRKNNINNNQRPKREGVCSLAAFNPSIHLSSSIDRSMSAFSSSCLMMLFYGEKELSELIKSLPLPLQPFQGFF